MDIVYIHDLEIDTIIGIYDWERKTKQKVRISLDLEFDNIPAGTSDNIKDALDYKQIAKRIIVFAEKSSFELVEALAENIAAIVLNEFAVSRLTLTLGKPGAVTGSREVGVVIKRSKPVLSC